MAYEFQKLSEVEALVEVPEGANALIEVNGDIKRVPGSGLGGGAGKALIIVDSNFTNGGGIEECSAEGTSAFTANMTLEEAMEAFYNCELDRIYCYAVTEAPTMLCGSIIDASMIYDTMCLQLFTNFFGNNISLYWTADGISFEEPGGSAPPV